MLCNNVFVCPGHQGKHLFVKIGKAALADAQSNHYGSIAYGIPNALALPGHKRVGWGVQSPIYFLEKQVSNTSTERLNRWDYGELERNDRRNIASCSRNSAKNRTFSIVKDEAFIKWRYESKLGRLQQMSRVAADITDGAGTNRVIESIVVMTEQMQ